MPSGMDSSRNPFTSTLQHIEGPACADHSDTLSQKTAAGILDKGFKFRLHSRRTQKPEHQLEQQRTTREF